VSVHPSDQVTTTDRARRGLNVAAAAVGIVLATPVMLLIALAIRCTGKRGSGWIAGCRPDAETPADG
jgi:lipopolysaccharide/colanic/teichoic acid biosynthesis glycosyltransferase